MGKFTAEEKRAQSAHIAQQGLSDMVARRLTSRQRPWVHDDDAYRMSWQDISSYEPADVINEVVAQLGRLNIFGITVEDDVAGCALRISVPQSQFNASALKPEGKRPLRIQEPTGRGR